MNKRGYTLIEVIAVIGILAVITGIFSINMTNILKNSNEEKKENLINDAELALDAWLNADISRLKNVPNCPNQHAYDINILINFGYLKPNDYPETIYACIDSRGVLSFS